MFRPAKPGDWAAEDDEDLSIQAPTPAEAAAAIRAQKSESGKSRAATSGPRQTTSRDRPAREPSTPVAASASASTSNASAATAPAAAPVANRWERFRQQQNEPAAAEPEQPSAGRWDRGHSGRDTNDRDRGGYGGRDNDRGYGGRDGGRDSDRGYGGRDGGRDYGDRDRDRGYGGRDRGDRGDRSDRGFERGGSGRGPPPAPLTTERGVVVSIRENFGFVSGVEREADLFFHISEAPVDVELQDEVEFKVKYNQRSEKDIAVQLVRLPKGSIVWEDIAEDFVDGVVTKGIPRSNASFHHSNHSSRDEPHGLIQLRPAAGETEAVEVDKEKVMDANPDTVADGEGEGEGGEAEPPTLSKRNKLVRFNADSVASPVPEPDAEGEHNAKSGKKTPPPQVGDYVRFRIATHRKSGQKRAVDLTVTVSARARLEKVIEAKLETMTRELGVVARVKSGGGFLRCCDRTEDVYFPFHEIRESLDDDKAKTSKGKLQLRDGDEVSFYVYEEKDGADDRDRDRPSQSHGSGRLTALRVVKVPTGTVSFEDVLRSDMEGVVTKIPKEPRNGPEVFGVINPSNPDELSTIASDEVTAEPSHEKGGKKLKKKAAGISFRLSDAHDVTYVPATGDLVKFDYVMDKRSRRVKASNVRVVQFSPKHRETGVITTVKDDFGFIKCADRSADAYFRFSDVMSVANDFRAGTEVAFDVSGGSGSNDTAKGYHSKDKDNVRALRVEILTPGKVKWETVVAADLEGEIVAVPARQQKPPHNKQSNTKPLPLKSQVGRIHVKLADDNKHLIDFFPEFKQQIDATFLPTTAEQTETGDHTIAFASTLSKHERAAIHAYCDWLGVAHASTGEGSSRQLTVTADARLSQEKLDALQQELGSSTAEIEFHADDAVDVRYNPRVGDRVKLNLVLVKRSRQLLSKRIVLLEAAPSKVKANGASAGAGATGPKSSEASNELPTGEGFIVAIKSDGGFGFIQPADQGVTGVENLFFHIKEIVSGETQVADLKEGMEVQYRVSHDEKKKKMRAVAITVVPAGTVKKIEASFVRGVVHRPSLLQRFRKTHARLGKHDKHKQQMSSAGRIRVTTTNAEGEGEADAEDDDEVEEDEEEEAEAEQEHEHEDEAKAEQQQPDTAEAGGVVSPPKQEKKQQSKKKPATASSYVYYISDITDPTVVLRDGDEVEFVPHKTPKGLRAMRVRLVQSHAKQGVVTKVNSDSGGVIRVDGDEAYDVGFTARNVLRGDVLGEGDRVEFALVKRPVEKKAAAKNTKKTTAVVEGEQVAESAEEAEKTEAATPVGPETTSAFVATSVLCLVSSGAAAKSSRDVSRPESRSVNSTLLQAMRQVGASAVAKSRMAKGPDGTRGFTSGWRTPASTPVETTDRAEP